MWDTEPMYDALNKADCSGRVEGLDRFCFYPFCELVDRDQNVGETMLARSEWSDHIQSPYCKWPGEGDCLQLGGWFAGLVGVKLTAFTVVYDVPSIAEGFRPEETSSESFCHQRPT